MNEFSTTPSLIVQAQVRRKPSNFEYRSGLCDTFWACLLDDYLEDAEETTPHSAVEQREDGEYTTRVSRRSKKKGKKAPINKRQDKKQSKKKKKESIQKKVEDFDQISWGAELESLLSDDHELDDRDSTSIISIGAEQDELYTVAARSESRNRNRKEDIDPEEDVPRAKEDMSMISEEANSLVVQPDVHKKESGKVFHYAPLSFIPEVNITESEFSDEVLPRRVAIDPDEERRNESTRHRSEEVVQRTPTERIHANESMSDSVGAVFEHDSPNSLPPDDQFLQSSPATLDPAETAVAHLDPSTNHSRKEIVDFHAYEELVKNGSRPDPVVPWSQREQGRSEPMTEDGDIQSAAVSIVGSSYEAPVDVLKLEMARAKSRMRGHNKGSKVTTEVELDKQDGDVRRETRRERVQAIHNRPRAASRKNRHPRKKAPSRVGAAESEIAVEETLSQQQELEDGKTEMTIDEAALTEDERMGLILLESARTEGDSRRKRLDRKEALQKIRDIKARMQTVEQ